MVELRTNAQIEKEISVQTIKLVQAALALPVIVAGMSFAPGVLAGAFAGGGVGLALTKITDLLGYDKKKLISENKLAHEFFSACLTVSLTQMVKSCFPDLDLEKTKKTKVESREYERISKILSNSLLITGNSFSFDEEILKNKTKFEPFIILKASLPDILRTIQKDHQTSTDSLNSIFDEIFVEVFNTLYALEKFNPLRPYFNHAVTGPVAESNKESNAWEKHYNWIHKCLFEDSLFGQEETEITISDVYVPLRGVFEHEIVETEPSSDIKQVTREIHICDLQDALTEWLESLDHSSTALDTIRLVGGSLGSGKSVFSKFFAHHVAKKNNWNMIYVDLQHLTPEGTVQERLQTYFEGETEAWEPEVDILSSILKNENPTLLIFDGLDELYAEGEQATELAVSLVNDLKNHFLSNQNRRLLKVAAVVLGRSAAIQSAKTRNELPANSLYSVMPLSMLYSNHLQLSKSKTEDRSKKIEVLDPNGLVHTDQRTKYWNKWQRIDPSLNQIKEDILTVENLSNLTVEPLLFYLLIFSGHLQKSDDLHSISRNSLYRDLFIKIYDRDKEKGKNVGHSASRKLKNSADFLHLMECLGLAVWQGGGSTGTKKHYEKYRDLHAFKKKETFKKKSFADIKNVALQFYVRNGRSGAKDFEFVHRSFGEYLSACAILRATEDFLSNEKRGPEQFVLLWQDHFSAAIISVEIHEFLVDEVQIYFKDKLEKAKTLTDKLTEHLDWLLQSGFPSHRLEKAENWRQLEERQKKSWCALLAILNALTKTLNMEGVKEFHIRPNWQNENSARRLIERLDLTYYKSNSLARAFNYWDFSGQNLGTLNLRSLNLANSHFKKADLRGVNLRNANLWDANLGNANLKGANLKNANLLNAILWGADLRGANLTNANLEDTDLWHANLNGTYLFAAKLMRADLRGANLREAELEGATLWRTDLREAVLKHANLKNADITGSSLISVDLANCKNLSPRQINSAFGDATTKLPKDMECHRPAHWHKENLEDYEAHDEWQKWHQKKHRNT